MKRIAWTSLEIDKARIKFIGNDVEYASVFAGSWFPVFFSWLYTRLSLLASYRRNVIKSPMVARYSSTQVVSKQASL